MNRIDPSPATRRLSLRITVTSGAALGLIAGVAVFGAVSSPASAPRPKAFRPASASRAVAPARRVLAPCARSQKLEHGVCIVHVVRTVTVPAPPGPSNPGSVSAASGTRAQTPAGSASTAKPAEAAEPGDNAADQAREAAQRAEAAAGHTSPDR